MTESERKVIAHVDMDCFYCACEVKKNPSLAGKPVVVGASPYAGRGVVSTANYEARKYGVKSAMPISKAFKLLPHGVYLRPDGSFYKYNSNQIMKILKSISDQMQQVSIDEAYLDITSFSKIFRNFQTLGEYVLKLIKKKTGLTASIGISYSKRVSKIASEHNKPFGVTVVEDSKQFLSSQDIGVIPGIGKVAKAKMNEMGLHKIHDFVKKGKMYMIDKFGKWGLKLYLLANGEDYSQIKFQKAKNKSISKERTFISDQDNWLAIKETVEKICSKLHSQLNNFQFKTVSIKIRYNDFTTLTRDLSFKVASNTIDSIRQAANKLLEEFILVAKPIRLVGVKLTNLIQVNDRQLQLNVF